MCYAHQATLVWVLSYLPPDTERPSYHQSGWTSFEQAVASILSPTHKVMDITAGIREELLSGQHDASNYIETTLRTMDRAHGVPEEPELKYRKNFKEVIADAPSLSFTNLSFNNTECCQLITVMSTHCGVLKDLELSMNDINTPSTNT
mmetsp:Transcript_146344/g.407672  ORF Transcript_146344/g.407672 Transcript_146344/m.407672 type:complete len:148 (-) Transcript_146344:716-1159(-)